MNNVTAGVPQWHFLRAPSPLGASCNELCSTFYRPEGWTPTGGLGFSWVVGDARIGCLRPSEISADA